VLVKSTCYEILRRPAHGGTPQNDVFGYFFRSRQRAERVGILGARAKSVIPESADGGYPESRKNNTLLDTGSRLRLVRYDLSVGY
jgi:hypothetical protein